jgi:hypothetical protein
MLRWGKHRVCDILDYGRAVAALARNGFRRRKLAVLYLYADTKKYPHTYAGLQTILRGLVGVDVTVVKVDNFHEEKEPTCIGPNTYDMGGDNRYWEFSGWKKGVRFLEARGIEADYVLFVNDAFLNLSDMWYDPYHYRRRLTTSTLYTLGRRAIGIVDTHRRQETLKGREVSSWIRSNFFLVPYSVGRQLDLVYLNDEEIGRILPEQYEGRVTIDSPLLNSELAGFLNEWITTRWSQSQSPSAANWPFLRAKLRAILNERLLTAQLRQLGVPILDINYART